MVNSLTKNCKLITLALAATILLLSVFVWTSPVAQASTYVEVYVEPISSDPLIKSDITLTWKHTAGDNLQKSIDGLNWNPIAFSIAEGTATYIETGVANWSIIYFKVVNGAASRQVNVYPPNNSAHANFSKNNTSVCAACHVTHSAEASKLLVQRRFENLCYSCHGGASTGSRYNVANGAVIAAGEKDPETGLVTSIHWRKSLGGPFQSNDMGVWGKDEEGNNLPVTSSHRFLPNPDYCLLCHTFFDQEPTGGSRAGFWDDGLGTNTTHYFVEGLGVNCSQCHRSHEPADQSYRLLKKGSTPVVAYAVNPTGNSDETGVYLSGMNEFCAKCHSRFNRGMGSGHTASASGKFRHAVGVPLELNGEQLTTTLPLQHGSPQRILCITCHFPHGTAVVGPNQKASVLNPGESTVLKRRDQMGVCQDCHKK